MERGTQPGPLAFNVADLFEAVADRRATSPAVIAGTDRLSYQDLEQLTARWASSLADLGVGPGDRVALLLGNSLPHVAALLGSFKLRAVPINVNQHYTVDELRHLLTDANPAVVICDDAATAACEASLGGETARLVPLSQITARVSTVHPQSRRTDRSGEDRYLLYTGGTTGLPKGVEWRQEDLFFAALGGDHRPDGPLTVAADALDALRHEPTRVLVASPLMHGTAQWVTLGSLLSGGTVVLSTHPHFDPEALLDLAEAEEVAQLVVVGDAFAVPLVEALDRHPARWQLDRLVAIASGGAALAPDTAARLLGHLSGAVVVDGYGTSETGGHARRIHLPGITPAAGFRTGPDTALIGADGALLARDSPDAGRIARRGRLPVGYRNDPARTAATFVTINGERWALSGDHGRWRSDGTLALMGRGERTVNSGGEKVDALEVESVIRTHPAVADVMVVAVPDARFGEVVGALIQLLPGAVLAEEDLAAWCRSSLARFKVPRRVQVLHALPRTPTGKPDYRGATEQLLHQAAVSTGQHEPARGPTSRAGTERPS
ncbi:MAG: AMP-binding protein [Acidimicrobiales bacterium]